MIRITFDKMGFPMARVRKVGSFHLWPVTKFQFRRFMEETGQYGGKWYEPLSAMNPETLYKDCNKVNYEGLFMTGILPEEALAFAKWLGEEYDLPTDEEWQAFYSAVKRHKFGIRLSPYGLNADAVALGNTLSRFLRTPLVYTFLHEGVVDWVRAGDGYNGRGAPRDGFFPNVWNPEEDVIKVIDVEERIHYFGFRLIKRPATSLSII
jgi:formylglycine-generating enzyme required for sulfatase activity